MFNLLFSYTKVHFYFQLQQKITLDQLSQELESVQQDLEKEGITGQNRDRMGRTRNTPIDQFLKRPSAPAKYAPQSDLQKMVDFNVLIFLATANLAFSIVDQPAFQRFVASLNPKAVIKTRTTYSRNTCALVWKNLKEALDKVLAKDLPDLDVVSFTSDLWQSRATDDFISLTIHFVDIDWSLRHYNIECRPFSSAHSGVMIGYAMDEMIRAVKGLAEATLKYMTTDGAANMKKACDESETVSHQLICLNHILNLAFKDACKIPAVVAMIKICKDLASACHYSTKRTNIIREKAEELKGEHQIYQVLKISIIFERSSNDRNFPKRWF
jgi:hypothetical protein